MREKNRKLVLLKWVLIAIGISALVIGIVLWQCHRQVRYSPEELGLIAVNSMYNFNDLEQLDRQMVTLKEVTSEVVFNQLTIDYEERSLQTYLKFKGKKTQVKIIRSTGDYVLYSLLNENIDESRIFMFSFEVDDGKITDVWEAECYGF